MAEHGGALREILAVFGFEVDEHGLKHGESALSSFVEKAKHLAEGLAAAFAVEKIYEWAESQVKAATQVERTATALGITTDAVQQLQYASSALGMEGDALLSMMGKLQVQQFKAAQGGKEAAGAFSLLGVSVKDAHGKLRPVDELLPDIAEKIKNTADPAKAAALATELFGKQGRTLLPFLKEGREGVEKYAKEFRDLGGGFGADSIEKAKEFEHQTAKLSLTFRSLASTVLQGLLPVIVPLVGLVARGVGWFRKLAEGSEIVKAALIVLGSVATVFAIQMAIASWPILAAAAAIGILVLLVDDLINLFAGNSSLIGKWIDEAFGKGASTEAVTALKDLWSEILVIVKEIGHWISEHAETIKKVVSAPFRAAAAVGGAAGNLAARLVGGGQEAAYLTSAEHKARLAGTFSGKGSAVKEGDVHFHVAGDMTKEVGEHTAKVFHEHRKRERRETAATFQRAPAATGGR